MKSGLYIHFPFCLKKCNYCDFYSIEENQSYIEQYVHSLMNEIQLYSSHKLIGNFKFQTIYIGGGTPSILTANQLRNIFENLYKYLHFADNLEITLEINPETADQSKLKSCKKLGVNRLSIGIQSFKDSELSVLQRIHNANTAIKSLKYAQQNNFKNLSIDLIYAIPGQSLSDWKYNLQEAVYFNPEHISIYGLTYEPGTILAQRLKNNKLTKTSEFLEREMYLTAIDFLESHGYNQYEISNFAMTGYNSCHNMMYWNNVPYLGLGPAAHSYWKNTRQWNFADIKQYVNLLKKGILPIEKTEKISIDQIKIEFIMLNLRKVQGINLRKYEAMFNEEFKVKFNDQLQQMNLYDDELYIIENEHFKLTKYGFLLYDEICSYFV